MAFHAELFAAFFVASIVFGCLWYFNPTQMSVQFAIALFRLSVPQKVLACLILLKFSQYLHLLC